MTEQSVGIIGASSFVGNCLISWLAKDNTPIFAYSRTLPPHQQGNTVWLNISRAPDHPQEVIASWICVAPIWILPEHFALLESHGAKRVVALSSTSRYSKSNSTDLEEQVLAQRLAEAEDHLKSWAEKRGIEWVILRPTLIYGFGRDKNIAEIARFIRRFGFFPLFGKALGLRQPVHAIDVSTACITALQAPHAANHAYNISGGETLAYREMVVRVFKSLDRRPHFLSIPLWTFQLALCLLRLLPRYKKWSAAMAMRMNTDLVFDHTAATHDLGYQPRAFDLPALKQQLDDDQH